MDQLMVPCEESIPDQETFSIKIPQEKYAYCIQVYFRLATRIELKVRVNMTSSANLWCYGEE